MQSAVPSLATRASAPPLIQPILNAFPIPNGPDLGGGAALYTAGSSHPSAFEGGSARVDHALTGNLLLFGRYSQTPSSTEFGASQIDVVNIASNSVTIGLNAVLSPSSINQLRLNRTSTTGNSIWQTPGGQSVGCYADAPLLGSNAPCASFYRFLINGIGELDAGINAKDRQTQWNLADSFQLRRGNHQLQFGLDYRRLALERAAPQTSVTLVADDLQSLLNSQFSINVSQAIQPTSSITDLSLFAADTWQLNSRLSLNYGLRWEFDPAPLVPAPPVDYFPPPILSPANIPVWRTSSSHFAPRAGLAYRLTADGKTVLRAGFGLYYAADFGTITDGINGAPYNTWQFNNGPIGSAPLSPATLITYAFSPGLRLPSTWEWNTTVERALTANDVLSIGYVGSAGRNLLRREVGSNTSAILEIATATSDGSSDYDSLQIQYRRRLARGFQVLASYAWSHSLDNGSADSALYWVPNGTAPSADWASSDFDVRHMFSAAFSEAWHGWALDGIFTARTGFPISVLDAETALGLGFANAFRPDVVPNTPLWIGRDLNPAAFNPVAGQGNLGRNSIRGFGTSNLDLAFGRTFRLTEKSSVELRAEAFNLFNHPAFADPVRFLSSPLFGQSTSMLNLMLGSGTPGTGLVPAFQTGGPRAVQLVARFIF